MNRYPPDVKLRPTIKLVNNNEVGTLTGQVANDLAEAEACAPSVYVFNDGVTPNGIEDNPDDPVATAIVEAQDQTDGKPALIVVHEIETVDFEAPVP